MIEVLLFTSDHCKYCESIEKAVKQKTIKYNYPINVLKKENKNQFEFFEKFNIVGVPTIILLYNNKIVWNNTGYLENNKIEKQFSKWSF